MFKYYLIIFIEILFPNQTCLNPQPTSKPTLPTMNNLVTAWTD